MIPDRVAFWGWLAIGFSLVSLPVFLGALNHDEAWYLVVAGRVLVGERLYVDVFDTNPPLIVWLNFPPLLLARFAGISEILAVRLIVLGGVAASLGLIGWILNRAWPDRPKTRLALLLLTLFVLVPVVGYDFAQREHLMIILALPYVLMASIRASGCRFEGGVPWVVGLFGGVGLAIKPHFGLLWLAVEANLIARRGWRSAIRPEGLAIVGVGLAYGLAVLAITPDYFGWIQRITSVYYGAGGASFSSLASEPGTILTILGLLIALVLRPEGPSRLGLEVIVAANLGLLVIAVLQVKGFTYQFYPAMALALLLIGWILASVSPGRADQARLILMVKGVLILLVVSVGANRVRDSIGLGGRPGASDTSLGRLIRVSKEHAGGGSVFAFSPAVAAGFPMVNYSGVGWASRHPALLFLPGCYPEVRGTETMVPLHPPQAMGESERFLFEDVIDKLLKDQPTLLLVDETGTPLAFDGRRFDYLAYYAQDPRFAGFFENYEPFARVDQFRVYRRQTRNSR